VQIINHLLDNFLQTLCNLLCEPWYCSVPINWTFSLLPFIPYSMVWELVACNSLNVQLLKKKVLFFCAHSMLTHSSERKLINCKGSFGKSLLLLLFAFLPNVQNMPKKSLYFLLFSSAPIIQNASTVLYIVLLHDTTGAGSFIQNYLWQCFHGAYFANECSSLS